MKTFKLTIDLSNAAFEGQIWMQELPRLLRAVAQKIENEEEISTIVDINGNSVGKVRIE
jgi:hypothetical protein